MEILRNYHKSSGMHMYAYFYGVLITAMINILFIIIMSMWIIELLWHDYIYVICLSFAALVLVLARSKASLSRVCAHRTIRSPWVTARPWF